MIFTLFIITFYYLVNCSVFICSSITTKVGNQSIRWEQNATQSEYFSYLNDVVLIKIIKTNCACYILASHQLVMYDMIFYHDVSNK